MHGLHPGGDNLSPADTGSHTRLGLSVLGNKEKRVRNIAEQTGKWNWFHGTQTRCLKCKEQKFELGIEAIREHPSFLLNRLNLHFKEPMDM